jgi:hypothetical protein
MVYPYVMNIILYIVVGYFTVLALVYLYGRGQ